MAKINIAFDTVTKALEVNMDGEKVENVSSVQIFTNFDDTDTGFIELVTIEDIKDEKIFKKVRLSADEEIVISEESSSQTQLHKDIGEAIKPRFHKLP